MGGTVGFTLREPDGTEHRGACWTNSLQWAVTNMRLVNKDPEHIKEVVAYDEEGTLLAPVGYGLVLVDMKENVILSFQNYTGVGRINTSAVLQDFHEGVPGEDGMLLVEDGCALTRLQAFMAENRVTPLSYRQDEGFLPVPEEHLPYFTIEALGHFALRNEGAYDDVIRPILVGSHFGIDMAPFTVENIIKEPCGGRALKQRVLDLGFVLTDEEEKAWAEFFQFTKEMEIENG